MRRAVIIIVAVSVTLTWFGLGCASPQARKIYYPHSSYETLGQSPDEHHRRIVRIADRDRRALAEDLDVFFLTDRPSRLTRWHSR
ncbi:MAG: hypothetical protein IIC01_10350 [Planctomycetes bacterium]|nr:hypothetical protein [Planctomycetota bacterium]